MIATLLLAWPTVQEPARALDQELDRQLETVAAQFADGLFQRRPWLVPERAWPKEVTPALGRYGAGEVAWWVHLVEGLQRRLRSLDFDEPAIEHDALAAMLEVEAILSASRTPERWDASRYVERVERTLFAVRHTEGGTREARRHAIERILAELPAYWADARSSLVAPLPARNALAIEALRSLERSLAEDVAADGELDRGRVDEAVRATAGFRAWLADSPASLAGGATVVGATHWEGLVQSASGIDDSLAEIKKRLLRELLALERATMTSAAAPDEVARDPVELVERTRAAMSEISVRLWLDAEFSVKGETLRIPLPVLGRLPVRGRAALLLPGADEEYALHIDSQAAGAGTVAGQICLAIRHGMPGEALLVERARDADRPAARYLWNRSMLEGWGLYVVDWATRPQRGRWNEVERDELARAGAELRKLVVARLLAALEIHADGLSLTEEAEVFRRRSGCDLAQAIEEVRAAQSDPLHGIGYLGYLGLRALEDAMVTRGASPDSFVTSILSHPHLRPADLHRKLGSRAFR